MEPHRDQVPVKGHVNWLGYKMPKNFKDLSEREILALAISLEEEDIRTYSDLAETLRVPTVATGDVHAHNARRAKLQDALVAIKQRTSLDGCERERRGNHESVLLAPAELLERLPHEAAERTREIADRCQFDLTQELGYRYPDFSDGVDPADVQLRELCEHAFVERYRPSSRTVRAQARERLGNELKLIARLGLAGFFLLHWEVLELARECALEVRGPGSPRHALPPGRGRGSSVGSIVCYLTGLSHVDPVEAGLSLGRFINDEMAAVPDIDLDFPRDIREKLIVRVTERYGREHAALVATFATYRSRGAIRDIGKAVGLPFAELERLARVTDGWDATRIADEVDGAPGRHTGPRWDAFRELTREIAGLPRHISQHPGGMVISTRPLIDLVPVHTRLGNFPYQVIGPDGVAGTADDEPAMGGRTIVVQPFGGYQETQIEYCDTRGWGVSQQCNRANVYGFHAGDYQLRAHVLNQLSRQATWCGQPLDGLSYADRALLAQDRLSATERASLRTQQARALAKLGRVQETLAAVGAADDEFARANPAVTPAWMNFYDHAQHHTDTGQALFDLAITGRKTQSAQRLAYAVAHHGKPYARSRAMTQSKLASVLMATRDPRQAAAVGHQALDAAANLSSRRAADDLRELRRHACHRLNIPEANELADRITERLSS